MGKGKAKPNQGQTATTAAQRSRQNRDRIGPGNDDTTEHRLIHSARLGLADHMLDEGLQSRLAHSKPAEAERIARAARAEAERQGAPVNPSGVRHVADAFDLLRIRNLLDKNHAGMNLILWNAGALYRKYWYASGMCGISAMDLTKDVVDGGSSAGGMPSSDYAMDCRKRLREANAVIGPRHASLFCAVVVHGETIASQRHMIFDSDREKTADVIALERLKDCLHRLCDLWGLRPRREGRIVSCRMHDSSELVD